MCLRNSALMIFTIMLLIGPTACVTSRMELINVSSDTRSVEGWLDARGALSVFPLRNIARYDPYTKIDAERCITVVTEPPLDHFNAKKLNGRRVHIEGRVVPYNDLPIMAGPYGVYLSKREFQGEPVE